jgi:2-keto-4-pentenoate hydratase
MLVGFLVSVVYAGTEVPTVLFESYKAAKPIPLPSSAIPDLTVKKAYDIQKEFVAKLIRDGGVIAGYKAGLTSPPAQKKFKAPGPVTGVLLKSMQIKDGTVDSKPFSKMMLEVEIGYRLNRDIKTPTTPETVKSLVDEIMPAVEVPDLNFATFKGLAFTDIIADNVGARGFILGNPQPVDKVDPNQVTGQLFMDGKALAPAVPGRAALGDQWKALSWSLNNVLANGGEIKKGMVVITGSLGKMYPGKPGSYKAVYTGGLDNLAFTVQ